MLPFPPLMTVSVINDLIECVDTRFLRGRKFVVIATLYLLAGRHMAPDI